MSLEVYEHQWRTSPRRDDGTIHTLVVRTSDGVHERPGAITLHEELGVLGDRWRWHVRRTPTSQVTLMERRVTELLTGAPERWHIPGDNLVVDLDLSLAASPTGTQLEANGVILEVTDKPHTGCDKFRARLGDDALRWVNGREHRPDRLRGLYVRVLRGGVLRLGDRLRRR